MSNNEPKIIAQLSKYNIARAIINFGSSGYAAQYLASGSAAGRAGGMIKYVMLFPH